MGTALLETYSLVAEAEASPTSGASDMIVRGVKVFKVGKFKNSRGVQNEWTAEKLQRAVENFNFLRVTGVFKDVPVRLDHSKSMRDVVGYFHELRFDGTFLIADIQFTKRAAYEDYQAGHLRGRSLEIGQYETNDEKLYDDVVQGLAFVDIPAVEGLHQRATGEENDMGTDNKDETKNSDSGEQTPAVPAPSNPPSPTPPANPTPAETPAQPATPAPTAEPKQGEPSEHRASGTVHTFRVNGTDVNDFAAVQLHIDSLEKVVQDTKVSLRNTFVEDLAQSGKILGPQKEQFQAHVATLSDDQFAAFREMYDGMPAHNIFGKHDTTTSPEIAAAQDQADALSIAQETIAQFRRVGKDDKFIQAQPAWAVVQAAADNGSK